MYTIEELVVIDKEIAGGTPVFKGNRVTVKTLFDYLQESSMNDFLIGYPTVSKEQAEVAVELAAKKLIESVML